jgi:hypothetical protein
MDRMEVSVNLFNQETSFGSGQSIAKDPAARGISVVHEFERHVYPFFKLFQDVQYGQFESDTLGDASKLGATAAALGATGGEFHATAQHMSPELSANTMKGVFSLIGASPDQADNLLMRLYLDTVERGIDVQALIGAYTHSGGNSPLLARFTQLVQKLVGRQLGAAHVPRQGERVIVLDGNFRGKEGVVVSTHVEEDYRETATDIAVHLANGYGVQLPKSWCMFLR